MDCQVLTVTTRLAAVTVTRRRHFADTTDKALQAGRCVAGGLPSLAVGDAPCAQRVVLRVQADVGCR